MIPIYNYQREQKQIEGVISVSRKDNDDVTTVVNKIIEAVRTKGDEALFEYTAKFDGCSLTPETIKISEEEIEKARALVSPELLAIIKKAAVRITDFHMKEQRNGWIKTSENGEILGQMIRPIERVGVYVPGGKAAYPSSVLMNVIPAKVAGVRHIAVATPAGKDGEINPVVLAAAAEAGAHSIYKIGGAQAVAALAYGTESVPKVDKITGPGNIYVATAKRAVFGVADIDSFAGPSEILIIADESANPVFVAADMLSQAEHDELARALLITTDKRLAEKVRLEIERQMAKLERKEIIEASIKNNGAVIIVETLEEAMKLSNEIAPEHLELCVGEPFGLLPFVHNAGAVFLGNYTPEPLGDYMAGPNHVLPTGGTARFFSPLSVDDFIKKTSVLSFSKTALSELSEDIVRFAGAEGLTAHANAISIRGEIE